MLSPVHHPSDEAFKIPVGEGLSVIGDKAFGKCRMKQRAYLAVKLLLERTDKFRQPCAEASNADFLNSLLPGVLIIGCDGIDFFQQHLRSKQRAESGKLRGTVAAQDAVAHDCGGQRIARDARKQRW